MTVNGAPVKSVGRALGLLDVLAQQDRGMTLTELSEATGIHKTTVHRLLAALSDHRFVDRHPDTGRYRIGLRVLELGQAVRRQVAPSALVRRHLTDLRDATGETCHYAVPAGQRMVYVEKIESRQTVRIASEVGDHLELYRTALGKAYLAAWPDAGIDEYLASAALEPRTPRTLTTPDAVWKAIKLVRLQGFAVDDRENELDIRCVGAVVRNQYGNAVGAVSLSAPTSRQVVERIPEIGDLVVRCVNAISRDMFGGVQ